MSKAFYSRIALSNIRKNRTIYLPYLLSGGLIVALYYILGSIAVMTRDSGMKGDSQMYVMLQVSSVVCGILSLVVLLYINSFVMKRRKKEFGLYNILGMGKRHISLVILWETLFSAFLSIAGGILGGALLSQLLFLVLMRLVRLPIALTFRVPLGTVLSTVLLFSAGFAVILGANLLSIGRSSAAALLRSDKEGEREPKARWLLAVAGFVTLAGGYLTAWNAKAPSDAMVLFFPAVLLVIAGTFLLFIAGSIAFLKLLRRNKRFYYRPGNFIAVSGMLYRMKQNAAGLANICILSTCVLVTLSSTVCLFIGEEDLLRQRFQRQNHVTCVVEGDNARQLYERAEAHAAENGFTVTEAADYYEFAVPASLEDGRLLAQPYYNSNTYGLTCLTLDDYNRLTGGGENLAPGEALIAGGITGSELLFGDLRFTVKGAAQVPKILDLGDMTYQIVAVLPDLSDLYAVKAQSDATNHERKHNVWYELWYNVQGDQARLDAFYASMGETFSGIPRIGLVDNIEAARSDFYQIYGSLLFVGIFFVTLFLIATVLIIYYKQITEGFDDRDRFQIMEKVGMSAGEIRSAIRRQILLVFFLPLGMAALHIAAAFPVLLLLLKLFQMDNVGLFLGCVLGAMLLFSALYFSVYRLTARTYFRIVQA